MPTIHLRYAANKHCSFGPPLSTVVGAMCLPSFEKALNILAHERPEGRIQMSEGRSLWRHRAMLKKEKLTPV